MLYGHGAIDVGAEFDFRRADAVKMNLYSWTREGIPVWDRQIQLAADDAIANGAIRNSYAQVQSSRIGGTPARDYILAPPDGLALPTIPAGYGQTAIPALNATVHHSAATLAASTRMVLFIDTDQNPVQLSQVINDASFATRPFDVLWCACRS